MSVVNKMLQDLDARNASADSLAADYQPPKKKSALPALLALLLLISVLGVAFAMFWPQSEQSAVDTTAPIESPLVSSSTVEAAPAEIPETKVEVEIAPPPEVDTPPVGGETEAISQSTETMTSVDSRQEVNVDAVEPEVEATQQEASASPDSDQIASKENDFIKPVEKPASVMRITTANTPSTAHEFRQQAQAAIAAGDNISAIQALTSLVDLQPENYAASKKLAAMLFAQGRLAQAEQTLLNALAISSEYPDLRLMLARLYFQQDQADRALTTLNGAEVSAELYPEYIAFRASLAESGGHFSQARHDYQTLAVSQPNEAKWWLGLAISDERVGNKEAALQSYNRAKALNQLSVQVDEFVQQRIAFLAGKE